LQDPAAYMVQLGFTIKGQLNVSRFHQAWENTAQNHAILRTRFLTASGCDANKNLQVVAKNFNAHWIIRSWEKACVDTMRDQFFQQERTIGFTPHRPWIRFGLFRTTSDSFKLLVSVHHALIDGWSIGLLLHSVCSHYTGDELPKAIHYRDFVDHVGCQDNGVAEQFWSNQFSGVEEPSLLVQAHHHPTFPNLQPSDAAFYGTVEKSVPILKQINRLISDHGVTLSSLLRVAMAVVLNHHIGSTDPIFGVVVSGRNVPVEGVETIIGACINTIPCRV
ncbi:condensation domain-containing protein, partial [Dimargaris cristalligena]